jgi:hypothetical protein
MSDVILMKNGDLCLFQGVVTTLTTSLLMFTLCYTLPLSPSKDTEAADTQTLYHYDRLYHMSTLVIREKQKE